MIDLGIAKVTGLQIIMALALGIGAATITIIGSNVIRPIGIAVVAFGAMYGYMLARSWEIMGEFKIDAGGSTVELIPSPLLAIFVTMNIFVFVVAVIQMVTGGWEPYK